TRVVVPAPRAPPRGGMPRQPDRERGRFDHLAVARPLTAGGVTGFRATATYDRFAHAGAGDGLVALGAAKGVRAEFDADPGRVDAARRGGAGRGISAKQDDRKPDRCTPRTPSAIPPSLDRAGGGA